MPERAPAFATFAGMLHDSGIPAELVIEAFNLAWRSGFDAGRESGESA